MMYTRRELESWKKSELIDKVLELTKDGVNTEKLIKKLDLIFDSAQHATKGDYRVYNTYKAQIDALGLDEKRYQEVIIDLCRVLRV